MEASCLKEKQIHVVTAFARFNLLDTLIQHYEPMGIIWHPTLFESELKGDVFNKPWIQPFIIPGNAPKTGFINEGYRRKNAFIQGASISNEDYYVIFDDDDMVESGVFDTIRQMDDDVIFISMKRGYSIPIDAIDARRYPVNTLLATPENIVIGNVSGQQYICKGKIFKQLYLEETDHCADGRMAIWLKENFPIRYEPHLYALFNYFEPGRWDKHIAFGCMFNDVKRLDLILRNSSIGEYQCYTIFDPESATKGLNVLLNTIEKNGASIGILTHQDMYYRQNWVEEVKAQIALLPEDWVIAGIVGKDEQGVLCGKFHDMSSPLWIVSEHEFPVKCSCIDECTIIVNMKSGFRFEEELEGFDLYGTYACLRANELGSAWIIDAWAEHYCTRFFGDWEPGVTFKKMWKWMYDRFPGQRLESTVLLNQNVDE